MVSCNKIEDEFMFQCNYLTNHVSVNIEHGKEKSLVLFFNSSFPNMLDVVPHRLSFFFHHCFGRGIPGL